MPSRFVRRSDGAQFAQRTTPLSPRHRTTLLAGTAFTGAFIAAMMGSPQHALAACAGLNTGSVTCGSPGSVATAGTLNTTFNGTTVVNVNAGGKIDTGGATAVRDGGRARTLTFNQTTPPSGSTTQPVPASDLTNTFGRHPPMSEMPRSPRRVSR